ncbi:MAG TPA: DUF3592 domain-containing protein [Methylomirabilota bacterium]
MSRSFLGEVAGAFPFWFGGIWLACGLPFVVAGVWVAVDTFQEQQRYTTAALITEGMVLSKRISGGSKESTSYWVSYRFPAPDGGVVHGETKISADLWDRLVEREPIRITYLPGRPDAHRLEDQGPDWVTPLGFTALGGVFAGLGGWIFWGGLRRILRERRLLQEGTRAEATVTDVEPANVSFNGIGQWRIRYRYRDHGGREHYGASHLIPPEEAEQWKVGDTGVARLDVHSPGSSMWVGKV